MEPDHDAPQDPSPGGVMLGAAASLLLAIVAALLTGYDLLAGGGGGIGEDVSDRTPLVLAVPCSAIGAALAGGTLTRLRGHGPTREGSVAVTALVVGLATLVIAVLAIAVIALEAAGPD